MEDFFFSISLTQQMIVFILSVCLLEVETDLDGKMIGVSLTSR